jgi:hypothetical protein
MDLKDAINNTKQIYMSDSSLNTLLDFERVLDNLDIFSFKNWLDGELIEGPNVERYWVSCSFMWPRAKMPDPRGPARLLDYGCTVTYTESTVKIPVKIEGPEDFRPGTKQGKLVSVPIWIVEIVMPQELISDIERGSLEIAGEEYDMSELQDAYKQDIDSDAFTDENEDNDFIEGN